MDFRIGPRLFLLSKKSTVWMSVSLACMFRSMVPTVQRRIRVAFIFPTWTVFISFIPDIFERPYITKFLLATWNIRGNWGKLFDEVDPTFVIHRLANSSFFSCNKNKNYVSLFIVTFGRIFGHVHRVKVMTTYFIVIHLSRRSHVISVLLIGTRKCWTKLLLKALLSSTRYCRINAAIACGIVH